jgi:hypothetical protein
VVGVGKSDAHRNRSPYRSARGGIDRSSGSHHTNTRSRPSWPASVGGVRPPERRYLHPEVVAGTLPDDRFVHAYVARGSIDLEGAGEIATGDAARRMAAADEAGVARPIARYPSAATVCLSDRP